MQREHKQHEQGLTRYLYEQLDGASLSIIRALRSPLVPLVFLLPYMPLLGVLPLLKFFQPFSYYLSHYVSWVWLDVGILLFITKRLPEKSIPVAAFVGVIFALIQRNSLGDAPDFYLLFMHSFATYAGLGLGLSLCYHFGSEALLYVLTGYFSVATLISLAWGILAHFGITIISIEGVITFQAVGASAKESFLFLQEKNFEILALTPCILGASLLYLKKKTATRKRLALFTWALVFIDALVFRATFMFPLLFVLLLALFVPENKLAGTSTRLIFVLTCILIAAFIAAVVFISQFDMHGRSKWWTAALSAFRGAPIIGGGTSTEQQVAVFDEMGACHNFYLYVLSQGGAVSLVLFTMLCFSTANTLEHASGSLKSYFTLVFPALLLTFAIDGFDALHAFPILIPLLACFHADDIERAPLRISRKELRLAELINSLGEDLEAFAKSPLSTIMVLLPLCLALMLRNPRPLFSLAGLHNWNLIFETLRAAKVLAISWFIGMFISHRLKSEHVIVFALVFINIIWIRRFVFPPSDGDILDTFSLEAAFLIMWFMVLSYQPRVGLIVVTAATLYISLVNFVTAIVWPLGMFTGDLSAYEPGTEAYTNRLVYLYMHKNSVVIHLFCGAIAAPVLHLIYRKKSTLVVAWATLLSMTLNAYLVRSSTALGVMLIFCAGFFMAEHSLLSRVHPNAILKVFFICFALFVVLRAQFLIPGWTSLPAKISTFTRRTDIWEIAMGLISEHPIFGTNYSEYELSQLFDNPLQPGSLVIYPHNLFLNFLLFGGIVAFVLLLVLFSYLANKLELACKTKSAVARFLFWIGLAMCLQMSVEDLAWIEFTMFPALGFISCLSSLVELELQQKLKE